MPPITFEDIPELDAPAEPTAPMAEASRISLFDLVERIAADRDRRSDWFDGANFSDPAWDILINLFRAHLDGRKSSLRRLMEASRLQPRTAMRWIALLEEEGVVIWSTEFGEIKTHVQLTERGINGMTGYLKALAKRWGYFLSDTPHHDTA